MRSLLVAGSACKRAKTWGSRSARYCSSSQRGATVSEASEAEHGQQVFGIAQAHGGDRRSQGPRHKAIRVKHRICVHDRGVAARIDLLAKPGCDRLTDPRRIVLKAVGDDDD